MNIVVLDVDHRAVEIFDDSMIDVLHEDVPHVQVADCPKIGDLWNGNRFEPFVPVPTIIVPDEIPIFPALLYLENMKGRTQGKSMFDDIDEAISNSGNKILQIGWQRASTLQRKSELLTIVMNLVHPPMTDKEVDDMFIQSVQIKT